MYGRHSGQKGYTSPEDAKGERAEPLCHAVFTERLFFFLLPILLFRAERLPPPIITTFAPTGADLSSREKVIGSGSNTETRRISKKRNEIRAECCVFNDLKCNDDDHRERNSYGEREIERHLV
ncbi:hypothetical protein KM043_015899 [Ampulex compressa]|nr:hypothetical protein KM043_015899 [Ampulex compressa]